MLQSASQGCINGLKRNRDASEEENVPKRHKTTKDRTIETYRNIPNSYDSDETEPYTPSSGEIEDDYQQPNFPPPSILSRSSNRPQSPTPLDSTPSNTIEPLEILGDSFKLLSTADSD